MKRNKAFFLSLAFFFGALVAAPAMALPIATLKLMNSPAAVGDVFQVEVWADGGDSGAELLSFGFDKAFEGFGVFEYTGYELGPGFDDDSAASGLDVAGSTFPGIADDDVLLATLSFSTLAYGSDVLRVVGYYDAMFSGLYYELPDWSPEGYDIDASLTISTAVHNVPEPATWIVFAICLVTLAGLKRTAMKEARRSMTPSTT